MTTPSTDMRNKHTLTKSMLSLGVSVFLGIASPAYVAAAPAYGTKMPVAQECFVGGQTHSVLERDLEANHGEVQSVQHFLNISYGVTDWLTLDLKGGAGSIDHAKGTGLDLDYNTFVGGGYGFRLRVYESGRVKAVVGFQHISIHPYSRNIGEEKYKTVLDDWQLSGLVSYRLAETLTPYVGAKVSRMDLIQWENGERDRIKSDEAQSFGVILGVDFDVTEKIWINVEGQAVDVQAVSASMNVRF